MAFSGESTTAVDGLISALVKVPAGRDIWASTVI